MPLGEVRNAGAGRHQILRIEHRHSSSTFRDVHPCDLEIGIVDAIEHETASNKPFGTDPGFDDKHASGLEMADEAACCRTQADQCLRIGDRTE